MCNGITAAVSLRNLQITHDNILKRRKNITDDNIVCHEKEKQLATSAFCSWVTFCLGNFHSKLANYIKLISKTYINKSE